MQHFFHIFPEIEQHIYFITANDRVALQNPRYFGLVFFSLFNPLTADIQIKGRAHCAELLEWFSFRVQI